MPKIRVEMHNKHISKCQQNKKNNNNNNNTTLKTRCKYLLFQNNRMKYHQSKEMVTQWYSRSKHLGTGTATQEELAQGFAGPKLKVWLNIYRVNNHVTKEMVEKHIKKQPGFENLKIMVSELLTKSNLKSFVVTAPLVKKDEMCETILAP
ncbi:unnamed protein product [Ceutorhynchus assimilis]|uniref:Uncharacterized protein n=1 Tax=Ceutorhynchus assimilis TaxID=467358 RepID=A0A9N9MQM1_9CUCU|nr:unnamed protein product [Ceutorhynchus assimilis]